MSKPLSVLLAAAPFVALALPVSAAEVQVKMLNKGPEGAFVFDPAFVKIQPGDTVRFVPTDKGHNVVSIEGMFPEGHEPLAAKIGEATVVTFANPGGYGYQSKT